MKRENSLRLTWVYLFIFILAGLIVSKLLYLQVFSFADFKKKADKQHTAVVEFSGKRGEIRDSKGIILAKSLPSYSLYAVPNQIKDKKQIARQISSQLSLSEQDILRQLSKDTSFVWIKRKLSKFQKDSLKNLNIGHIGFIEEPKRIYPQGKLLSHVLGIVDIDERGLEGTELYYNKYLQPTSGKLVVLKDSRSRILPLYKELVPSRDGFDVILTIDSSIQYWAEVLLEETVKDVRAKGGSVLVMNPGNGDIYALANYPVFDPNNISAYPLENRRNKVVTDFYEPGSVFKIVTLVSALGEKPELTNENFFCEYGAYKIPGSILHDWKEFGNLSFIEVFKNSSNIGVAKIANAVGEDVVYRYILKLGFGRETGVDLPGETAGFVKPVSAWSKTSKFIIPMGQEVCVSLLQLVQAFGIIANGGYSLSPHITKKIIDNNNVALKENKVPKKERILKEDVAEQAKQILYKVVDEGTGRRAKIDGIKIGGKTGTAQKINPRGGYSHQKFYASFTGFFPVDNPQYVIGVVLDEPRKYHYGGMVAAPLFRKVAKRIIEYKGLGKED